MRSKRTPTGEQLRLGHRRTNTTPTTMLATVIGDPAYLHEIDPDSRWSRKQLEKAVNLLIGNGTVVRYGRGTRRLYASTRTVPPELGELTSAQIRVLQYMPVNGAVTLANLEAMMNETGALVAALAERGLIVRIAGKRDIVALTRGAIAARKTLGENLALPALDHDALAEFLGPRQRKTTEVEEIERITAGAISPPTVTAVTRTRTRTRTESKMQPTTKRTTETVTPETETNLYAYLLLRTDMPSLGRGKGAAHAMHAGNHMTHELWVRPLLERREVDPRVEMWHAQGGGFGTTIALGRAGEVTLDVVHRLVRSAHSLGLLAGKVRDHSYPYIVDGETLRLIRDDVHTLPPRQVRDGWLCCRDEITAVWLMGNKDDLAMLLARFDLAPND